VFTEIKFYWKYKRKLKTFLRNWRGVLVRFRVNDSPLKTKIHLNFILKFSSCLTENEILLHYKAKPIKQCVEGSCFGCANFAEHVSVLRGHKCRVLVLQHGIRTYHRVLNGGKNFVIEISAYVHNTNPIKFVNIYIFYCKQTIRGILALPHCNVHYMCAHTTHI
jgi:hypothetical protein